MKSCQGLTGVDCPYEGWKRYRPGSLKITAIQVWIVPMRDGNPGINLVGIGNMVCGLSL